MDVKAVGKPTLTPQKATEYPLSSQESAKGVETSENLWAPVFNSYSFFSPCDPEILNIFVLAGTA